MGKRLTHDELIERAARWEEAVRLFNAAMERPDEIPSTEAGARAYIDRMLSDVEDIHHAAATVLSGHFGYSDARPQDCSPAARKDPAGYAEVWHRYLKSEALLHRAERLLAWAEHENRTAIEAATFLEKDWRTWNRTVGNYCRLLLLELTGHHEEAYALVAGCIAAQTSTNVRDNPRLVAGLQKMTREAGVTVQRRRALLGELLREANLHLEREQFITVPIQGRDERLPLVPPLPSHSGAALIRNLKQLHGGRLDRTLFAGEAKPPRRPSAARGIEQVSGTDRYFQALTLTNAEGEKVKVPLVEMSLEDQDEAAAVSSREQDPQNILLAREEIAGIAARLEAAGLSEKQRLAIMLDGLGNSRTEIAVMMSTTVDNVDSYLYRGRKKII